MKLPEEIGFSANKPCITGFEKDLEGPFEMPENEVGLACWKLFIGSVIDEFKVVARLLGAELKAEVEFGLRLEKMEPDAISEICLM